MEKKTIIALSLAGLLFLPVFSGALAADSYQGVSRLEMDYGTSYKLAKYNQILNPQTERNLEPVLGLNGRAAEKALERYWKNFESSEKTPTYSINFGSIK